MEEVSPRDRLTFTLFVAVLLHAGLILGVTFTWQASQITTPTIEITLATHDDSQAPVRADFAAQANQLGSGTESEVIDRTTDTEADFHSNEYRTQQVFLPPPVRSTDEREVLTTAGSAEQQLTIEPPSPDQPVMTPTSGYQQKIFDLSKEIASLEARLDSERQMNARQPRVRRLTSVSAKKTADAYYLSAWTRKVESVGNINYPGEARRKKLYGELRLLVSISPDGALKEISVLESSGHKVLDEAAIRIVKLAAPFAPFPEEMRRSTDLLEIIRS